MADISPVANVLSVVGLADVVYRSIVQVAGLYVRYCSSSDDVARLLDNIRTLVDITASVRGFAVRYNGSSSGKRRLPCSVAAAGKNIELLRA